MVGVSDPELAKARAEGWRFLRALTAGYLVATILLSVLLTAIALPLRDVLAFSARRDALLVAGLVLGIADVLGRTPDVKRQVPQRFMRDLRPVPRGLLWGFDLGLLVTTRKTSSLLWATVLGLILVGPVDAILPALLAAGTVYVGGVVVLTLAGASNITVPDFGTTLIPALQRMAGVLLVGLAVAGWAS